ncbi:MAG: hypothetical protein NDI60_10570 [Elusimicrobiales bacterium]|nr:hypothetical protein [Elusimicrobiales bacterium]
MKMKLKIVVTIVLINAALLGAAEPPHGQNAMLLLGPDATAEQRAAAERLKADLAAKGVQVVEIPAEEAEAFGQAGILSEGGLVVETQGDGAALKISDGASGKSVKKFVAAQPVPEKTAPAPEAPVKKEKPLKPAAASGTRGADKKNHIGLSLGHSGLFSRNEDSFDALTAGYPGGSVAYDPNRGRFRLFYERALSKKYSIGIAAGKEMGGSVEYEKNGSTLSLEPEMNTATLYVIRRITRGFGLFAGAGADMYSYTISDPVVFSGNNAVHSTFQGEASGAHAEAGILLAAGNFSLRLGLKQILFGDPGDITSNFTGGGSYTPGKYRLIVRNGQTLDFKAAGQPLASNEKPFKPDLGGKAVTISLNYAFANW